MREDKMLPSARKEGVLIQELADDLLVYDLETHKAHCLNKVAALVWENCDGKNSVCDLAAIVGKELNERVDEDIVWLALNQLEKVKLLDNQISPRADRPRMSRRELIRKAGIAAMIAIPVVTSIIAPQALASASSCGGACATGADCATLPLCPNCPGTLVCSP